MTTKFESVESAKNYAAYLAGVDPKTTEFVEDSRLKVEDMSSTLINDSKVSKKTKKEIHDQIAAQKGFRFKDKNGKELQIVIGPLRDGFDLWLVGPNRWPQQV